MCVCVFLLVRSELDDWGGSSVGNVCWWSLRLIIDPSFCVEIDEPKIHRAVEEWTEVS